MSNELSRFKLLHPSPIVKDTRRLTEQAFNNLTEWLDKIIEDLGLKERD